MKPVNPNHILGIDVLRFFAAILVMWFHYGMLMGIRPEGPTGRAAQKLVAFPELYGWSNFGWIGVQIFFVISGFVIAFSSKRATPFNFFVSRVVRLGPAVWICASLTLLIAFSLDLETTTVLARAYRHSMFFLPWEPWIDGSYWTLTIEIAFYALVFLLLIVSRFNWIGKLAVLIGLLSTAYWLLVSVASSSSLLGPYTVSFLASRAWRVLDLTLVHHGVFFAIGILLWKHLCEAPARKNIFWCSVFAIAGCIQISNINAGLNFGFSTSYSPITGCAIWLISLAILIVAVKFNYIVHQMPQRILRSIKTAGLMTYPLYLLHQIAGAALMGILVSKGINRWFALIYTFILVFITTWIISKYIEPKLQGITKSSLLKIQSIFSFSKTKKF